MNKQLISAVICIATIILLFVIYKTLQVPDHEIHYHANFALFVNNKQIDFSKPEFMHITPCEIGEQEDKNDPDEWVHLHDNIGNVVHVHHDDIHWSDFFKNIKYDINHVIAEEKTKAATAKYYLNGIKTDNVLPNVIGKDDQLLISIGKEKPVNNVNDDPVIKQQFAKVGNDAIEYDEGKKVKENCGGDEKLTFFERMKIAFGM